MSANTKHFILPPPPIFGVAGGTEDRRGASSHISLDDIFDEFIFTAGQNNTSSSRGNNSSTTSSTSKSKSGINDDNDDDSDDDSDESDDEIDEFGNTKPRKRPRGQQRHMTEEQKVERRERNREHAKRSRVRKKFLLESLQQSVHALQGENEKLKVAIREHLVNESDELLSSCFTGGSSIIAADPNEATRTLDDPDYSLVKALQTAQQNFVITDPSMPDNPIVYASQGFLSLTGYTLDQVLGRNCRFLQGPDTDPKAVDKIRHGIETGEDTTVVLLNYRVDGSTFWNQFFVAALRDGDGNVVNYLGVQCKVSEDYAKAFGKTDENEDSIKINN